MNNAEFADHVRKRCSTEWGLKEMHRLYRERSTRERHWGPEWTAIVRAELVRRGVFKK